MRRRVLYLFCSALLALGACSSDDPFAGSDGGGDGDAGGDGDGDGDSDAGSDERFSCFDAPTRMTVLGDSITACAGVGGALAASCGPKMFHDTLGASYAPNITYENVAVNGAVTADVPNNQLANVTEGAGHLIANIYVGGNDLQPYIFSSDANAMSQFAIDMPAMISEWERVFAYFDDATAFPDGVTIVMNEQYNPFDDCTASPYNLSAVKIALLQEYNAELAKLAAARSNVVITKQHGSYLGHGHHYNVASCPFYVSGSTPFMNDLIHPNAAGHGNLAQEWSDLADRMYRDCD